MHLLIAVTPAPEAMLVEQVAARLGRFDCRSRQVARLPHTAIRKRDLRIFDWRLDWVDSVRQQIGRVQLVGVCKKRFETNRARIAQNKLWANGRTVAFAARLLFLEGQTSQRRNHPVMPCSQPLCGTRQSTHCCCLNYELIL